MPVNHTALLGQGDWDEATIAWATRRGARIGTVHGTMGGTHQKLTRLIKETIGLIVHFHGHMAAPI